MGAGAATGLLLAWAAWPRRYKPNLNAAQDETIFNAFLKIDKAGRIIVIVPQAETGQGVTTLLPQILADELGADWRTVGVQAAPVNPLYANTLLAKEWLADDWSRLAGGAGDWAIGQYATRRSLMLTGGGTSVPMFHTSYREAGAAARVLLCQAAAARWDVPWESCDIRNGIISDGGQRTIKIGEVAAEAAKFDLPEILPFRQDQSDRLIGQDLPRLDTPSKIDGSHNFAADVRLPDMLFASIRQGPIGDATLSKVDEEAAKPVTGFIKLVRSERWVAAVAANWWAANKALDLSDPVFELSGAPVSSASIEKSLVQAFADSSGQRLYSNGDLKNLFENATVLNSEFSVAPSRERVRPPQTRCRRTVACR